MPLTICPTASVTMRALSPSPPMRIPLTNPTTAASTSAMPMAVQMRSSDPCPTPTVITAARVSVPGTLRSMPPVMITSIWPSAVMARNVPNGAIELRPGPRSVAGAQIEAMTTSSAIAMYTGR